MILQPAHFRIEHLSAEHSPLAVTDVTEQPTVTVTSIPVGNLREATDQFQRQIINNALKENDNNWAATARQLSVDVGNLHRLAKRISLKK